MQVISSPSWDICLLTLLTALGSIALLMCRLPAFGRQLMLRRFVSRGPRGRWSQLFTDQAVLIRVREPRKRVYRRQQNISFSPPGAFPTDRINARHSCSFHFRRFTVVCCIFDSNTCALFSKISPLIPLHAT